MNIRLIELGPFGSRIDRGSAKDLRDLPLGYEAKKIEEALGKVVVYIEPTRREKQ